IIGGCNRFIFQRTKTKFKLAWLGYNRYPLNLYKDIIIIIVVVIIVVAREKHTAAGVSIKDFDKNIQSLR
ncbi:MAG: hypothetical protein C4518_01915, partial [Desulfobacteraceae bacterium]